MKAASTPSASPVNPSAESSTLPRAKVSLSASFLSEPAHPRSTKRSELSYIGLPLF